jgi:predicted site-specific integrase-resolvase
MQLTDSNGVCTALGISLRTLQDYRDRGLIPYVRFSKRCVRYDPIAVQRAISRLSVNPEDD